MFKLLLLRAQANSSKVNCLLLDKGREFINTTFQTFYQERKIKIRYITSYINEENRIAK